MKGTALDPVIKSAIAQDYVDGLEVQAIVKKYSVCERTVYTIRQQMQLTKRCPELTEQQRADILLNYAECKHIATVSKTLDIDRNRISKVLREVGINTMTEEQIEARIAALAAKKLSGDK
jgi:transposase